MNKQRKAIEAAVEKQKHQYIELLRRKYQTHDELLDAVAELLFLKFGDKPPADFFSIGLSHTSLFSEGLLDEIINAEQVPVESRLEVLDGWQGPESKTIKSAINLRKTSVSQRGGKAKAEINAAQDREIVAKYVDHKELHVLSSDKAATQLIDKHPEITVDLGISYRRVADLIRKQRK